MADCGEFVNDLTTILYGKRPGQRLVGLLKTNQNRVYRNHSKIAEYVTKSDKFVKNVYRFLHYCHTDATYEESNQEAKLYLYRTLLRLTFDSDKLRIQLTEASVPKIIGQDLEDFHSSYQDDEKINKLVEYGLGLLLNCSLTTDMQTNLRQQIMNNLMYFVDSESNDIERVIDAIIIIENIYPENCLCDYFYPESLFGTMTDLIRRAQYSPEADSFVIYNYSGKRRTSDSDNETSSGETDSSRGRDSSRETESSEEDNKIAHSATSCTKALSQLRTDDSDNTLITLESVLKCADVVCRAEHYQCRFLTLVGDTKEQFSRYLRAGSDTEKDTVIRILTLLTGHGCKQCVGSQVAKSLLIKHDLGDLVHSGQRSVTLRSKPDYVHTRPVTLTVEELKRLGATSNGCVYFDACRRYLESLNISDLDRYCNIENDTCFCQKCMRKRRDEPVYCRGEPPAVYALPAGWAKMALRTSVRAEVQNIWDRYHVAYHGTRAGNLQGILETGELLLPGDVTPSGEVLRPPWGHFTDEWKPDDFDVKQIFLSSSILYAGLEAYSSVTKYKDEPTGIKAHGRVAFQVRIKPGSYGVGPDTIGAGSHRIDPHIDNRWSGSPRGGAWFSSQAF